MYNETFSNGNILPLHGSFYNYFNHMFIHILEKISIRSLA